MHLLFQLEKAIFSPEYNTLINLGGFANITKKIYHDNLIAYDVCPLNIVFNQLCKLN